MSLHHHDKVVAKGEPAALNLEILIGGEPSAKPVPAEVEASPPVVPPSAPSPIRMESFFDFASSYLRHLMGFIGIHDVEFITSEDWDVRQADIISGLAVADSVLATTMNASA